MRIDLVPRVILDVYTSKESRKHLFIPPTLSKRPFFKFRSTCLGRYHTTYQYGPPHLSRRFSHWIRNCNEIALFYVRLLRQSVDLVFLIIDKNMTTHCAVASAELLKIENIQPVNCFARSSDLNLIAQV